MERKEKGGRWGGKRREGDGEGMKVKERRRGMERGKGMRGEGKNGKREIWRERKMKGSGQREGRCKDEDGKEKKKMEKRKI